MSTTVPKVARALLFGLALAGTIGVLPIVQKQVTGVAACPALGPIPACYLVLLGYVLIAVSALPGPRYRFRTFAVGWIPLFLLAISGSGLEFFIRDTCPRTSDGVPTCYLSLGLLCLLAVIYLVEMRYDVTRVAMESGE